VDSDAIRIQLPRFQRPRFQVLNAVSEKYIEVQRMRKPLLFYSYR